MNMPLSVLVIEDDRIDQLAFCRLVDEEKLPYDYLIVNSIHEAVISLSSRMFDIIISDYHLSDGTAFDILASVQHIPVIVVTGAGNEVVAVAAMKAGAYDYLTKDTELQYLKLLPIIVTNALKRKQAEQEAGDLMRERMRRETLQNFIRDASHDLRTPLSTLGTSLYLMERYIQEIEAIALAPAPTNVEKLKQLTDKALERCRMLGEHRNQLEQIIVDMLEIVKIENVSSLEMKPHDIRYLVEVAMESAWQRAVTKSQTLNFDKPAEPIILEASAQEFVTIIRNLLKNAIEYTANGGAIRIHAKISEAQVLLSVSDTGIGIPANEIQFIFNRFYRVEQARTMSNSGSGLGLAIVKQLVDLHHGKIAVESEVGIGSTFTVYFPRMVGDYAPLSQ